MVRPSGFGYDAETAESNRYQQSVDLKDTTVAKKALAEFEAMVSSLRLCGVRVIVVDDVEDRPDSIFPNNWFSTHDNRICLYPMAAPCRRKERDIPCLDNILRCFKVYTHIECV